MESSKVDTNAQEAKSHPEISKIRPMVLFVILPTLLIIISTYFPAFGIPRSFPKDSIWYNLRGLLDVGIFFGIWFILACCYVYKLENLNLKERFIEHKSLDDDFLKGWHPEDAT